MKVLFALSVLALGFGTSAQASFIACTATPNSKIMHGNVGEAQKATDITAAVEFNTVSGKHGEVTLENLKGTILFTAQRQQVMFSDEALGGRFQVSTNHYEFTSIHTTSTDLPTAHLDSSSSSSSSLIVADDNDGMSLMLPEQSMQKKTKDAFQATLLLDGTLSGGRIVLDCKKPSEG